MYSLMNFTSYIHYWKRRFQESPLRDFCSVININTRDEGESQALGLLIYLILMFIKCKLLDIGPKLQYNLLCDELPEDKKLRKHLQLNKLVSLLTDFSSHN